VPRQLPPGAPRTVLAAAVVVALEAAALVLLGLVEAVRTAVSDAGSPLLALATAAMAVAAGMLLGWLARSLAGLRRWARSPVVVVQLIALPVGWTLAVTNGRPLLGLPVLAMAVAVLALLATPDARAALDRG
jgi:hypothetical protein